MSERPEWTQVSGGEPDHGTPPGRLRAGGVWRAPTIATLVGLVFGLGCGEPQVEAGDGGPWRSEVEGTAEGRLVRTLGGSLWRGTARAVEIASIGAVVGPGAGALGDVPSVAISRDRVFVLDRSLPAVRVYDLSGAHVADLGRRGEGPGEFQAPYLVAAAPDGSVYVRDLAGVTKFGPSGAFAGSWNVPGGGLVLPLVLAADGGVFAPGRAALPDGGAEAAWLHVTAAGDRGDAILRPRWDEWRPWTLEARGGGRTAQLTVPFAPRPRWSLTPSGSLVELVGDAYRLRVRGTGGRATLVERVAPAVTVPGAVADALRSSIRTRMRAIDPDWEWNARPIPDQVPPLAAVTSDAGGRLWVQRTVSVELDGDCGEDGGLACVRERRTFDVFLESGEFLGTLDPGVDWIASVPPAVQGDHVALVTSGPHDVPVVRLFRVEAELHPPSPPD